MKKYILSFGIFIHFTFCVFGQEVSGNLSILVPRSHNPAFAMPGDTINIEIREAEGLTRNGWSGELSNDLTHWNLPVIFAEKHKIHHGTEDGWLLKAIIPGSISPELMELSIIHESQKTGKNRRAVSIVPELEQDFYVLHQSDEHVTTDKAVEPGGKSSTKWGNVSKEAIIWLTPVVNLINPRFLVQSGDNCQIYHNATDWVGIEEAVDRTNRFLDGMGEYKIPTIITTGNHDIGFKNYIYFKEWTKMYNKQIGQRAFSFKMGSFYVLSYEWTNDEFRDWAKADYLSTYNDENTEYRLLVSHFFDGIEAESTLADANHPADLLLVGHIHRTRIIQEEPYHVLSVQSAQNYQTAAFLDFRKTSDGWETSQAAQHADGINVHKLVGDYGAPKIKETYKKMNIGTKKSNQVVIENSFPHNFYDGRIRFLMKNGDYEVEGGEILSSYSYDNDRRTAVLVKVDIQPESHTSVSIRRKKN